MNSSSTDVKKRIMFLKGDDLYFLTYNIFIFLKSFDCCSESRILYDHNKLAFLIDFIADSYLMRILGRAIVDKKQLSFSDKQTLQTAYTDGLMRRHVLSRLIFALEKKGFLKLFPCKETSIVSLAMSVENIPVSFFDNVTFNVEENNSELLRKTIPRLRTMSLNTLLNRLFNNNGAATWRV